jgi:hypothetical protein
MLIATFDSSLEGFEDCAGPATMTAIRRAIEGEHPLIQFLAELATFEYVRSPPIRYQNLLLAIFRELASQDLRPDENPLLDFVRGLPYVPESAFEGLTGLCPLFPEQSDNILNALTEYVLDAIASQTSFLGPLLNLSIHESDMIQVNAIKIVQKHFYKEGSFCIQIDEFAKEQLGVAVRRTEENERRPLYKFFFSILELNPFLFHTLLDEFCVTPDGPPKEELIRSLGQSVARMPFNKEMLGQALSTVTKENDMLLHAYLNFLTKGLPVFQADVAEMIKAQLRKPDPDARYLIPIIPTLSELEFKAFLPTLLTLGSGGLRTAIRTLLTVNPRPVTPPVFLIELHKYPSSVSYFAKVIEAMRICFQHTEIYKYEVSIQAVDVVAREHPLDLIMYTLLEMIQTFKDSHRYIIRNVLPILISRGIFREEPPWSLMKELLWKTSPLSIKTAAGQLEQEQMRDYIATYPDMKSLMLNHAKTNRIQWIVQLLSEEQEQDQENPL